MDNPTEFVLMGVVMKRLVSAAETGGAFSLFENRSEGPSRTPVHVHRDDDETLYVLEGEMTAIIGGEARTLGVGQTAYMPRGVPHQIANESGGTSRYLLLCTTGIFEQFLAEAGAPHRPGEHTLPPTIEDIERLKVAAPRHGITILPGW